MSKSAKNNLYVKALRCGVNVTPLIQPHVLSALEEKVSMASQALVEGGSPTPQPRYPSKHRPSLGSPAAPFVSYRGRASLLLTPWGEAGTAYDLGGSGLSASGHRLAAWPCVSTCPCCGSDHTRLPGLGWSERRSQLAR